MNGTQLELDLSSCNPVDIRLFHMQLQVDAMQESMSKVRRSLFAQMGELKKMCFKLQSENEEIKTEMRVLKNEKTEWRYGENDCLFDASEYRSAIG